MEGKGRGRGLNGPRTVPYRNSIYSKNGRNWITLTLTRLFPFFNSARILTVSYIIITSVYSFWGKKILFTHKHVQYLCAIPIRVRFYLDKIKKFNFGEIPSKFFFMFCRASISILLLLPTALRRFQFNIGFPYNWCPFLSIQCFRSPSSFLKSSSTSFIHLNLGLPLTLLRSSFP